MTTTSGHTSAIRARTVLGTSIYYKTGRNKYYDTRQIVSNRRAASALFAERALCEPEHAIVVPCPVNPAVRSPSGPPAGRRHPLAPAHKSAFSRSPFAPGTHRPKPAALSIGSRRFSPSSSQPTGLRRWHTLQVRQTLRTDGKAPRCWQ
jgi:hypothetical protein